MKHRLCDDCIARLNPQFVGTKKQIAWAAQIATDAIQVVIETDLGLDPAEHVAMARWLRAQRDAVWWIRHRGHTPQMLYQAYQHSLRVPEIRAALESADAITPPAWG